MVGKTKTINSKIILTAYNIPVNPMLTKSSWLVKVIPTLGLQAIRYVQVKIEHGRK
jgi:hypothetical protein